MNKQQLEWVADHLKGLSTGRVMPRRQYEGICDELRWCFQEGKISYDIRIKLIIAMREWPEKSGNQAYPVPHPIQDAFHAYMEINNLWVGEYGDARKRLCTFLSNVALSELEKLS